MFEVSIWSLSKLLASSRSFLYEIPSWFYVLVVDYELPRNLIRFLYINCRIFVCCRTVLCVISIRGCPLEFSRKASLRIWTICDFHWIPKAFPFWTAHLTSQVMLLKYLHLEHFVKPHYFPQSDSKETQVWFHFKVSLRFEQFNLDKFILLNLMLCYHQTSQLRCSFAFQLRGPWVLNILTCCGFNLKSNNVYSLIRVANYLMHQLLIILLNLKPKLIGSLL